MGAITFAQPDVALRASVLAYIAANPTDTDIAVTTANVITDGNIPTSGARVLKIEASAAKGNGPVEGAFITLTAYSSTSNVADGRPFAYRLKDVLPRLAGAFVITDVNGPSKGSDLTSRRVWILTCRLLQTGADE